MNLWTQIGKNYYSPLVASDDELQAITSNGLSRSGEAGTIVGGWYVSRGRIESKQELIDFLANFKISHAPSAKA